MTSRTSSSTELNPKHFNTGTTGNAGMTSNTDTTNNAGTASNTDTAVNTDTAAPEIADKKLSGAEYIKSGEPKKPRRPAGFLVRQRELARRRLWPIALTLLSYLIYHIVCTATLLSNCLEEAAYFHYSAAKTTGYLQESLVSLLGKDNVSFLVIGLPLAAMLAIEGFSWLHSRREVDFYESLPVPRGQRFFDICAGSFLYFIISYIVTLAIGLLIANGFGALDHAVLMDILHGSAKNIAFFIAVYALGVLSTMLTGNVIVSCLAFCVLLLYEIEFRAMLKGYSSVFYATWSDRSGTLFSNCVFSPIAQYFDGNSTLETVLRLLALAVLYFLLAWICRCMRKNERAGTAVVFVPVKTVVRIAMSLMIGLFTGLLFASIRTGRGVIISVIWMLLFTVITACIMQIIYDYDFRALFRRPLEIVIAIVLALLIYMGFAFDITGYDRFIPDAGKVEDAALVCVSSNYSFCTEDGEQVSEDVFGEKYMHLKNVDDVIAIASYGQEFTRKKAASPDWSEPETGTDPDAGTGADAGTESDTGTGTVSSTDPGTGTDANQNAGPGTKPVPINAKGIPCPYEEFDFLVVYHMKSGKTISRRFVLPSTMDPAMMSAVVDTQSYREGSFNIYHDDILRSMPESFLLECTNGQDQRTAKLTSEQYEAFREAYLTDLDSFTYAFARENVPFATVLFTSDVAADNTRWDDSMPALTDLSVSCPVYPSFGNTIRVLKDCGVWPGTFDYIPLLRAFYDYTALTPEEQAVYDMTDMSVFSGPFHSGRLYNTRAY